MPERPAATRSRLVLLSASVALLLFDLALFAGGVYWLIIGPDVLRILGFALVLIAIECRIRFPKIGFRTGEVTSLDAPQLHAIVEQARIAVGAPRIDILLIRQDWTASCGRSGLRRRTVLTLGLPLWGSLGPDARLALLGHELGHLVNGDPTTAFTTQPALTTFARLAVIFDPEHVGSRYRSIIEWFFQLVCWPIHRVFVWAHLGLARTAAQDHQRAETYADALGVRLGGTAGARELSRVMLFDREARQAARRAALTDGADPGAWRSKVQAAVTKPANAVRTAEQLSLRYQASAYASHPPDGLRHRLVASWPTLEPAVQIAESTFADADRELARHYERIRRALVSTPA